MSTTHINDSTHADDGHRRHGCEALLGGPSDAVGGPEPSGHRSRPPVPPEGHARPTRSAPPAGYAPRDRSEPRPGYGHPAGSAPAPPGSRPRPAPRRGPADPVRALMHQHRELCERAVDPLEIAAGLEAHGVTDRTAARFRHRDVFSLAEELYARVPRDQEPPRTQRQPAPAFARDPRPLLLSLVPGALAVLTIAGREALGGAPRAAVTAAGTLAVAAAVIAVLRRGPLGARGRTVRSACLWTLWLVGYAAYGEDLIGQIAVGGPEGPLHPALAPLAGLALAVAPAAWCARLFAVRARRRRDGSRGLAEFATGTRPLLLGTVALYAGALITLLVLTGLAVPRGQAGGALAPAVALGLLLFLARLLVVHGFARAAATGLAAACAAEALAPLLLLAGRLPGCSFLARPVEAVTGAWGAGAVPALACALAATVLLVHATAALSRASAHTD